MEEKFQAVVPLPDLNKSLEINVDGDEKVFRLGSDVPILVENKSPHFLYFDLANNYIKLFMIRDAEWVEVKDGLTGSGSRVLSPQGTPPLNLDYTWARPVLDDQIFKDNKTDILIRIVMTGEIMEMDQYSDDWRNHESEVLTGESVCAYVDVYISP